VTIFCVCVALLLLAGLQARRKAPRVDVDEMERLNRYADRASREDKFPFE
jgi:hypothetical protein